MPDQFVNHMTGLTSPGSDAFVISASDSNDLAISTRAIWVGVAGDVVVTTVLGTTLPFLGATAGSVIPIRARRVHVTGTTASGLVGII